VSKNVKEHKALAREALRFLFWQAEHRAELDEGELWERFAKWFIHEPDISVNHVRWDTRQRTHSVAVGGGARVGFPPFTLGPFGSAGAEWVHGKSARAESGHTVSQVASKSHAADATALVTLAGTAVAQFQLGMSKLKLRFPAATSFFSSRADIVLGGDTVQVRLTLERGRVQPNLSLVQRMFRSGEELEAYLMRKRDRWEACLPGGGAALDKFIADMRALPAKHASASRIYQERERLTHDVADELTQLIAHLQQLERAGQDVEAAQVRDRMLALLLDPANLVCEKLAVSEVANGVRDGGFTLLAMLRSRLSATSTNRYLLQLKPG
jgi:hypothetical protein